MGKHDMSIEVWIILTMYFAAMPAFIHSCHAAGQWKSKMIIAILVWPVIGICMAIVCLFEFAQGKDPFR